MISGWPTPLLTSLIGGCLPALQLGFHIGVLNAPQAYVQNDLDITSDEFGIAVSVFSLGGLVGAAFVGKLADRVGRKGFFILSAIPFFVCGLFTFLVEDFAALLLQRILLGVMCGASTVVVPAFLKEIAPRDMVSPRWPLLASMSPQNQPFPHRWAPSVSDLRPPLGSPP